MKSFFLVVLLASGNAASAQQEVPQPFPYKKVSPGLAKAMVYGADTTGQGLLDPNSLIQQRSLLPQATFSHNTSRGKIYKLPIDNMPCLVPDMKQVRPMPQYYPTPRGSMPNAMPKQQIIPSPKEKDKQD